MTPTSRRIQLREQLEATERKCAELRAELERTEEWEPEGGDYYVSTTGNIGHLSSEYEGKAFGTERPTFSQAEQARDIMRIHNRALAYVQEHAPDWDGGNPVTVFQDDVDGEWMVNEDTIPSIGAVTGPEDVMRKLADDLNSGRVKL